MTNLVQTPETTPQTASARAPDLQMTAVAHDLTGRALSGVTGSDLLEALHTGRHAGPCGMVAVSPRGTLFFSPAVRNEGMGTDVLRSRDAGRSFAVVETPRAHRGAPKGYKLRIVNLLPHYFERLSRKLPAGPPYIHFCTRTPRQVVSSSPR